MADLSFSLVGFEYWLFVFARIASFVFIAPIFGQTAVPTRVRIAFAVVVSALLYNVIDKPAVDYVGVMGYAVVILREVITGLLIGYAANVCSNIVLVAGNIIDMDIGLSMVTEFNPEINSEISITGNIYYYFVMLLMLTSNMHTYVLRAACDSFTLIPAGRSVLLWDHLLASITKYMLDLFTIGFRIFLPFFVCIMVLNVILGIMAKVAPQMNMFAVGMQMKVLLGLVVLFITVFLLPYIADMVFDEIKTMVVLVIDGLHE